MSQPEKQDQAEPLSGTDPSSDRFDRQTAGVPDSIGGETVQGEILPPGDEPKVEADTGWPIFDLQMIGSLPFFFLKRRYGDVWEIDDEETEALAKAWKPLLDRYLPLEETEWGTALLVSLAIVGPRAMQTDWSKNRKQKKNDPQSTQPESTRTGASGASAATSGNGSRGSQPEWDVLSDP